MSSDLAIRVEGVSKHYVMFERSEDRLKQMVVPRLQRLVGRPPKRYFHDFSAVNDTSFTVRRGETVGIIGRNGSGKSTLLQMICGTLQPTTGKIEVNGRVAALLELGAGFNPEFTGRENVYLNAAILGLSHAETASRFEDIERFADIGIFIDQPVKTYSSGMYVRLAFAVAINVDPDILVIDEALAVGDEAFQRKCFARIEDIRDKGATILFVSHGAQTIVQLCDRAMLFDRGEMILEGQPKTVVNQYQRFVNLAGADAEPVREEIKAMDGWASAGKDSANKPVGDSTTPSSVPPQVAAQSEGDGWYDPSLVSQSRVEYESRGAQIGDLRITTLDGRKVNVLTSGHSYCVHYSVDFEKDIENCIFGMQFKTVTGSPLAGANNANSSVVPRPDAAKGERFDVTFEFVCRLLTGTYVMDVGLMGTSDGDFQFAHRLLDALLLRVTSSHDTLAVGQFDLAPQLEVRRTAY